MVNSNSLDAHSRLAVYGSLAPGKRNHDQLEGLKGQWRTGIVRGRLVEEGWGATIGYPGLRLDDEGQDIDVQMFESADLPAHWERLDRFEGPEYARIIVPVALAEGAILASIYVIAA